MKKRVIGRRAALAAGAAVLAVVVVEDDARAAPPAPPSPAPPGSPGAPPPIPSPLRIDGRVSRNHGHVLALALADVEAGEARTFDLTGTSGHRHEVTFTRDHLAALRRGEIVRLATTSHAGHLHRIYARVRPQVLPPEETNVCDVFIGGKDDHELVIPRSHLEGDAERTYDIQANSPHAHRVVLRGADFARLRRGEKVVVTSGRSTSDDGHTHVIFITHGKPVGGAPRR